MADGRHWTAPRKLLLVVGALVLTALVLQALESLAPAPSKRTNREPAAAPAPIRPALERVEERIIKIDAGFMHQSRFRFGDTETVEHVDAVYACLEEGIAREFDDNPTSKRSEVSDRLNRIQTGCLLSVVRPRRPSD